MMLGEGGCLLLGDAGQVRFRLGEVFWGRVRSEEVVILRQRWDEVG